MPTTGRIADAILIDELDVPREDGIAINFDHFAATAARPIDWGIRPTAHFINNEPAQAAPMPWDRVPAPQPVRVRNELRSSAGVYGEDYS